MDLQFDFPHVFNPDSNAAENAEVLAQILEHWTRINMLYLRRHPDAPTMQQAIASRRAVYFRTTVWDCLPGILAKGGGDCKSLAPAHAASRRVRDGMQARCVFRWIQRKDGKRDFHILVETPLGWEDPSRWAGMGTQENARPPPRLVR